MKDYGLNLNTQNNNALQTDAQKKYETDYILAGGRDANLLEKIGASIKQTWIADDFVERIQRPKFVKDIEFTEEEKKNKLIGSNIPIDQYDNFMMTNSQKEWDYLAAQYKEKDDINFVMSQMSDGGAFVMNMATGILSPTGIATGFVGGAAVGAARAARTAKIAKTLGNTSPKLAMQQSFTQQGIRQNLLKNPEAFKASMTLNRQLYNPKTVLQDIGIAVGAGAVENAVFSGLMVYDDMTLDTNDKFKQIAWDAAIGGVISGAVGGVISGAKARKTSRTFNEYETELLNLEQTRAQVGEAYALRDDILNKQIAEQNNIVETNRFINDMVEPNEKDFFEGGLEVNGEKIETYEAGARTLKKHQAFDKISRVRETIRTLDNTKNKISTRKSLKTANDLVRNVKTYRDNLSTELKMLKEKSAVLNPIPTPIAKSIREMEADLKDMDGFLRKANKDPVKAVRASLSGIDNVDEVNKRVVKLNKEKYSIAEQEYNNTIKKAQKEIDESYAKIKEYGETLAVFKKKNMFDFTQEEQTIALMTDPNQKEWFGYLLEGEKADILEGRKTVDYTQNPTEYESKIFDEKDNVVARGFRDWLLFPKNYFDEASTMSNAINQTFAKIFKISARKDNGIVEESVEERINSLEGRYNTLAHRSFQTNVQQWGAMLGRRVDSITGLENRLEFGDLVYKVGQERLVGKTETLAEIRGAYGEQAAKIIEKQVNDYKKYTDTILREMQDAGLEISEEIIQNKEFYAPVNWRSEKIAVKAKNIADGDEGYQELTKVVKKGILAIPENRFMLEKINKNTDLTYADVVAEAFIYNTMSRAKTQKKVSVQNAEQQLSNLEELLDIKEATGKAFVARHGLKHEEVQAILSSLRSKMGADTSKRGANKHFNKRMKMDYSVGEDITMKDGSVENIKVWDLLNRNIEGLYTNYNRKAAGQIAFTKIGIRSYEDLQDMMKVMKKSIPISNVKDLEYFNTHFDLDSTHSAIDSMYSGRPTYNMHEDVRELMKYSQATDLIYLPLTQMNENFMMAQVGGAKQYFAQSKIWKTIVRDTQKNKYDEEFWEDLEEIGVTINHANSASVGGHIDNFDQILDVDNISVKDKAYKLNDKFSNITNAVPQAFDARMRSQVASIATNRLFKLGVHLRQKRIKQLQKTDPNSQELQKLLKLEENYKEQFGVKAKGQRGSMLIANESTLGEFGIDVDDAIKFAENMQQIGRFTKGRNPVLVGYKPEHFSGIDPDNFEKVAHRYTKKTVDAVIQQNYKGQAIPWIEKSAWWKVVFQFRTHPIQAISNHARRYTDFSTREGFARFGGYMANAIIGGALVQTARVGLNSLGYNERDRDDYLKKELHPMRLAMAGLSKSSYASLTPDFVNGISYDMTRKGISDDGYSYDLFDNPSLRKIGAAGDLFFGGAAGALHSLGFEQFAPMTNSKMRNAMSVIWGFNAPFMKDAFSQMFFDGRDYKQRDRLFEED